MAGGWFQKHHRITIYKPPTTSHFPKCDYEINAPVISCDVSRLEDIEQLMDKSIQHFGGGADFILHSVAMSYNIRKKNLYTKLDYELFEKTLDVSALSLHKILQTCYQKDALNEFASVVALSFIAAHKAFPNYNDMKRSLVIIQAQPGEESVPCSKGIDDSHLCTIL